MTTPSIITIENIREARAELPEGNYREWMKNSPAFVDFLLATNERLVKALRVVGCRGFHNTRQDRKDCKCVVCAALVQGV